MTTLATPLRAEPDKNYPRPFKTWLLKDANGEILATGLTKETADTIVEMSERDEQMRKALASADDALDQIRNAQGNTLNPHHLSQIAYAAHNEVKAALAAGGNVLCS